jgi:hypothetical protein
LNVGRGNVKFSLSLEAWLNCDPPSPGHLLRVGCGRSPALGHTGLPPAAALPHTERLESLAVTGTPAAAAK